MLEVLVEVSCRVSGTQGPGLDPYIRDVGH